MSFFQALKKRRPKLFTDGRQRPIDRNLRARLMHRARALKRRTEPGRHYGAIHGKDIDVLQALLFTFANMRDGRCIPGYERLAEAAGCAKSTVGLAIARLEAAGLLRWVNRIRRVREAVPGLPGVGATMVRVLRSSNSYSFGAETDFRGGTQNPDSISLPTSPQSDPDNALLAALERWTNARKRLPKKKEEASTPNGAAIQHVAVN